jgi:hypothetical protein
MYFCEICVICGTIPLLKIPAKKLHTVMVKNPVHHFGRLNFIKTVFQCCIGVTKKVEGMALNIL